MVEPTLFNGDIEFDIETIPKALNLLKNFKMMTWLSMF